MIGKKYKKSMRPLAVNHAFYISIIRECVYCKNTDK